MKDERDELGFREHHPFLRKKGMLVVISGFSGSGKGTLMKQLMQNYDYYSLSVSATTRAPRPGEEEGREYFFVSKERFMEMIQNGELLEYAKYVDNYYGTPKAYVEQEMAKGKDVILEIEMQGALQVKAAYPEAVLVFVLPPSLKELENRIRKRGTESEEQIALRMKTTLDEIGLMEKYDYFVINDDLDQAIADARAIMKAEHCKTAGTAKTLIERFKEEK
jgi:guanylate kinase